MASFRKICGGWYGPTLCGNRRLVYARNVNEPDPILSQEQIHAAEDVWAVEDVRESYPNRYANLATRDPRTARITAGVREDLAQRIGPDWADRILDRRLTSRLRTAAAEEIKDERMGMGPVRRQAERVGSFLGRKFTAGYGFFGNVRRLFSETTDIYGSHLREAHGNAETTEERRLHLARQFWDTLDNGERNAVQTYLQNRRRVALPAPPFGAQLDALRGIVPGSLAEQQIRQIDAAQVEDLRFMREDLAFMPTNPANEINPSSPQPPQNPFDYLLRFRIYEMQEREKLFANTNYHAGRLQGVLDSIRRAHPNINDILQEIMQPNALVHLENNPEALALVYELELRYKKDPKELRKTLEDVRDHLPATKEEPEEGAKLTPEQQRVADAEKHGEKLKELRTELSKNYSAARASGRKLHQLMQDATTATGRRAETIQKQLGDAREKQAVIAENVETHENEYRDSAVDLLKLLDAYKTKPPKEHEYVLALWKTFGKGQKKPKNTKNKRLFGDLSATTYTKPKNGAFEKHIRAYTDDHLTKLTTEIDTHYASRFKKREKCSARQALYLLLENQYAKKGNMNDEQRLRRAVIDANGLIAHVENQGLYNAVNNELAEQLGGTTLGSNLLDRARKWSVAKLTSDEIYEASDIIDRVTGSVKGMEMFYGLRADMSYTQLQYFMDRDDRINPQNIKAFSQHLVEAVKGFTMSNYEGGVELYDKDAPAVEQAVLLLQRLAEVYASRKAFDDMREKEGTKAQLTFEYMGEYDKTVAEERKSFAENIINKLATWRQKFNDAALKATCGDSYRKKLKERHTEKWSDKQWNEMLVNENLVAYAGTGAATMMVLADKASTARRIAGTLARPFVGAGRLLGRGWRGIRSKISRR